MRLNRRGRDERRRVQRNKEREISPLSTLHTAAFLRAAFLLLTVTLMDFYLAYTTRAEHMG
jgi:hypothetical protein